ncbi:flagellar hook-basal body protein [Alkalibacter mobilis]|uniref:flagellar hook-basal body protein n=1 Tax=Alkalibacter mobilis TaxID=2787712 RepID=UPI00189E7D12|nr:flagellar hook basal-body protein [Alkalibacter mobilis]MBF7096298.1 flagellar hook basal-body protein [Alkalibacter mobilis]
MFHGLKIGSSGMRTSQKVMDNVADQIANSGSEGYKKKQINFQELLINKLGDNQVQISENGQNQGINAGSRAVFSKTDFTQGTIVPSYSPFHLAIEGRGFFGTVDDLGQLSLTRNGCFHQNADNSITDDQGNILAMDTYVDIDKWPDGESVNIGSDGVISFVDEIGENIDLGKVVVFAPENSDDLITLGEGRFLPGEDVPVYNSVEDLDVEFGVLRQRHLENSNVDMTQSITEMLVVQRVYQANAKSVTTADDMLEVINTIV